MQLLELTPAETAFLKPLPAATDHSQQRLTQRLAAVLTARLRLPVQIQVHPATVVVDAQATPIWLPDAALATLWLTRRLGGQRVVGVAPFVPRTLIHTLDEVLAECWLDGVEQDSLPAALAWQVSAAHTQARLAVHLPHHMIDMTHWARGVIRHVWFNNR